MKNRVFQLLAILLLVVGVGCVAWFGGYKRGYRIGSKNGANGELKMFRVISSEGKLKVATSEGFMDVISSRQVEQLPDKLTLTELFSVWGRGHFGGLGSDPTVFFYLASADGDFYWILWDQRDADALLKGRLDEVRVRSIALSRSDSPSVLDVVWGVEPVDIPYIPSGSPFEPTVEAEQAGAGKPATRSESKSDGDENPNPEAEGSSR